MVKMLCNQSIKMQLSPGQRVLITDDLLATGGTIEGQLS